MEMLMSISEEFSTHLGEKKTLPAMWVINEMLALRKTLNHLSSNFFILLNRHEEKSSA